MKVIFYHVRKTDVFIHVDFCRTHMKTVQREWSTGFMFSSFDSLFLSTLSYQSSLGTAALLFRRNQFVRYNQRLIEDISRYIFKEQNFEF